MRLLLSLLLLALPISLFAQDSLPPAPLANQQLPDAEQETQARELMESIRCLTCQGQSVVDSDAPMASDMRHQIRTRIAQGESPEGIRAWLIERYGDYISYDPKISTSTWPLFAAPFLLVGVALLLFWSRLRKRGDQGE